MKFVVNILQSKSKKSKHDSQSSFILNEKCGLHMFLGAPQDTNDVAAD